MARIQATRIHGVVAAALLAGHAGLLLAQSRMTFITADEVMNVAAGVASWRTGRFFIYRVNPPLTKMLAVLPALALQPRGDFRNWEDDPAQRVEFRAGLVFIEQNRSRILDLVFLSRLMGVGWSLLGGWLIFRWAGNLYGTASGFMALGLWCFDPYVLGHAALVTSDVPAAVAGLLAALTFQRYLKSPTWGRAFIAGLTLGLAELTKFTNLVFVVVWPALWMVARRRGFDDEPPRARPSAGQLFLLASISLSVVNMGYGYQGFGRALGDYRFVSRFLTGSPTHALGNRFTGTPFGAVPVPLPEDYVRGIDVQRVDFEGTRRSYLAGTWSSTGWWYFYLYALAVKLPLGTLALMLWGVAGAVCGRGSARRSDEAALLVCALAILALLSSQTGYTMHSRYAIPALPFLMIIVGRVVVHRPGEGRASPRRSPWGLLLATAASSLWIYPHSLSYFNEISGGPSRGSRHLIDSNIDWGQDVFHLKRWLAAHPEAEPLKLAYYNFQIDPGLAGLAFEPPPRAPADDAHPDELQKFAPPPGYYAVSVNLLHGDVLPIPDGRGGFLPILPHDFEYFRSQRPIARAGYSILIYYVTDQERVAY